LPEIQPVPAAGRIGFPSRVDPDAQALYPGGHTDSRLAEVEPYRAQAYALAKEYSHVVTFSEARRQPLKV
jgi:hypothetical protein